MNSKCVIRNYFLNKKNKLPVWSRWKFLKQCSGHFDFCNRLYSKIGFILLNSH